MEVEPVVLAEPHESDADSLVSTNDPDDMANEQTWPTEEEMNGGKGLDQESVPDAQQGTTPKSIKRVPKGTSEYQASWIVDEEEEDDEDAEEDKENRNVDMEEDEPEELVDLQLDEEMESENNNARKSVAFDFEELDDEEEGKQ